MYRKLRHKLFGVTAEDVMADAAIAARIDSLGFLTPKHLDIKSLKGLEDKDGMWVDVVVSELGPRLEGGPVCRN